MNELIHVREYLQQCRAHVSSQQVLAIIITIATMYTAQCQALKAGGRERMKHAYACLFAQRARFKGGNYSIAALSDRNKTQTTDVI